MNSFYGEIKMFGQSFAPRNWAYCAGQTLNIAQNTALYSLLGTIYGGDGRTTFGVPDLRGHAPMGAGTGPGLTPAVLGFHAYGAERIVLSVNEMPNHSHSLVATDGIADTGITANDLNGCILAQTKKSSGPVPQRNVPTYSSAIPSNNEIMYSYALSTYGASQAHENRQPFCVVNFCICLVGSDYPARN